MVWEVGDAGVKFADGSQQTTAYKQPNSMVRLHTANGYGSTNTTIRRFLTTVINQGSDIAYTDSATSGASFTINTAGVYAMSWTDNYTSGNYIGFSLNSNQLTTGIQAINAADRLAMMATSAAEYPGTVSTTLYLPAGSVIRPHGTNGSTGVLLAGAQFTIVRVA